MIIDESFGAVDGVNPNAELIDGVGLVEADIFGEEMFR